MYLLLLAIRSPILRVVLCCVPLLSLVPLCSWCSFPRPCLRLPTISSSPNQAMYLLYVLGKYICPFLISPFLFWLFLCYLFLAVLPVPSSLYWYFISSVIFNFPEVCCARGGSFLSFLLAGLPPIVLYAFLGLHASVSVLFFTVCLLFPLPSPPSSLLP